MIVYLVPDWSHLCSLTSCINSPCLPLSCASSSCPVCMKVLSMSQPSFHVSGLSQVCNHFLILLVSVSLCLYLDPRCECFLLSLIFSPGKILLFILLLLKSRAFESNNFVSEVVTRRGWRRHRRRGWRRWRRRGWRR